MLLLLFVCVVKERTEPSSSTRQHHREAVQLECTADHLLADLSKVAVSADSRGDSDSSCDCCSDLLMSKQPCGPTEQAIVQWFLFVRYDDGHDCSCLSGARSFRAAGPGREQDHS